MARTPAVRAVREEDAEDVAVEPLEGTVIESGAAHVLTLDGVEFICDDDVKLGFLIRSAKNGLEGLHDIITHCYPGDANDVFDVTDNLSLEEIGEAVKALVESYTERPTQKPSPSRGGQRRTGRR